MEDIIEHILNEAAKDQTISNFKKYTNEQIDELFLVGGGIPWKEGESIKTNKTPNWKHPDITIMYGDLYNFEGKTEGKPKLFYGLNTKYYINKYLGVDYEASKQFGLLMIKVTLSESTNAVGDNSKFNPRTNASSYSVIRSDFSRVPKGKTYSIPLYKPDYYEAKKNVIEINSYLNIADYTNASVLNERLIALPVLLLKLNELNGFTIKEDIKEYVNKGDTKVKLNLVTYPVIIKNFQSNITCYSPEEALKLSEYLSKNSDPIYVGLSGVNIEETLEYIIKYKKTNELLFDNIYKLAESFGINIEDFLDKNKGLITLHDIGMF